MRFSRWNNVAWAWTIVVVSALASVAQADGTLFVDDSRVSAEPITGASITGGQDLPICELQKLLADGGFPAGDEFGSSVSVSGDVALVGAEGDDDNGFSSGSAYAFRWNGTAWAQDQKLLAGDGVAGDEFGWSVSLSGDVALVGAWGFGGNGSGSGSAYVFRWNGTAWVQEQKLLPDDGAAGDLFGGSVSISGDVALVGTRSRFSFTGFGSAYVFRWNGTAWVQEQKLLRDGTSRDLFGESVSVSGDVALIGANEDDDHGVHSGSAYVFRWTGSDWSQE